MNDALKWMIDGALDLIKSGKSVISGLPEDVRQQVLDQAIEILKKEKEQKQ